MVKAKPLPELEYLRECFDVDWGDLRFPLVNRVRPKHHFKRLADWKTWNNKFANKRAGRFDHGYVRMVINNQNYYLHRVLWKLLNNQEPATVDHRDGNTLNNHISNLRGATKRDQMYNTKRPSRLGLPKGVSRHIQRNAIRFAAQICINGVQTHVGMAASAEEASALYQAAAVAHFGEYASHLSRARPRLRKPRPRMAKP